LAVELAFGRAWVATSATTSATVLNGDGSPNGTIPGLPGTPAVIASSFGIWVVSAPSGSLRGGLTRTDPRTGHGRYRVQPDQMLVQDPIGVAASPTSIWVASSDDTVTQIGTFGANNGRVLTKIRFSAAAESLAVGDHAAWVDTPQAGLLYRIPF
jgi:hypothetical protein